MVQFASHLRRVLCKTRLLFPRINGPIVPNRIQTTHLRFDRNLITTWQSRTGNENVWKWNGKYRSNRTDRSKKTNSGGDHFDRKIPRWTEISDNLGIMESSLCLDTNYNCREGDRFFSVLHKILRGKWENDWSCFLTRYFPLQFATTDSFWCLETQKRF